MLSHWWQILHLLEKNIYVFVFLLENFYIDWAKALLQITIGVCSIYLNDSTSGQTFFTPEGLVIESVNQCEHFCYITSYPSTIIQRFNSAYKKLFLLIWKQKPA